MPSPFQDRQSIVKYTWREMEPGTILYLNKSVEHEAAPRDSRYVRTEVKFVRSTSPNTIHELHHQLNLLCARLARTSLRA
jgi:hypothetical protein